jgi:hypothetical protein
MDHPKKREPTFKKGNAVKYKDELWQVGTVVGGYLEPSYSLHPVDRRTVAVADENELEPWSNE